MVRLEDRVVIIYTSQSSRDASSPGVSQTAAGPGLRSSIRRSEAMDTELAAMPIIDIDTHYTEPRDLWTSRAPQKLRDLASL